MRQRLFARWEEEKQQTLNNVCFSDEVHFHLDGGVVNKQNVRFWATENPHALHEQHHGPRSTVWIVLSSYGLIGTFFYEEIVNSKRY